MNSINRQQVSTIREETMLSDFDVNNIQDAPAARDAIVMLLNMIENIKQENQELKEQNQCLKDEINRLKGEQGKPKVKPNKSDKSDDAPQFKDITEELSLCWVHDGRHYKKLTPFI